MADFTKSMYFVMKNEDPELSGVVVPEPNGGVAKWGINSIFHPDLDVPNLSLNQAYLVYYNEYWLPIWGKVITNQQVATKMMDLGVNTGVTNIVKEAQKAWNSLTAANELPLKVDGVMGQKTLKALNTFDPVSRLLSEIIEFAIQHYQEVHIADTVTPEQKAKIVAGWVKRAQLPVPA